MRLTVENDKEGKVEIYMDVEGLDLLIDRLKKLRRHSEGDHDHLMTPSWAGWELTEDKQGVDNELINHLCLILKPVKKGNGGVIALLLFERGVRSFLCSFSIFRGENWAAPAVIPVKCKRDWWGHGRWRGCAEWLR